MKSFYQANQSPYYQINIFLDLLNPKTNAELARLLRKYANILEKSSIEFLNEPKKIVDEKNERNVGLAYTKFAGGSRCNYDADKAFKEMIDENWEIMIKEQLENENLETR
jgi:hypothetical protein